MEGGSDGEGLYSYISSPPLPPPPASNASSIPLLLALEVYGTPSSLTAPLNPFQSGCHFDPMSISHVYPPPQLPAFCHNFCC